MIRVGMPDNMQTSAFSVNGWKRKVQCCLSCVSACWQRMHSADVATKLYLYTDGNE